MATAKAHTNIALVKYWGKENQELIIPQTDSLSLTLNEFYTITTVNFDDQLTSDQVYVDKQLLDQQDAKKVVHILNLVRELSGINYFAKVNSTNHVPTAAGLASSASAFVLTLVTKRSTTSLSALVASAALNKLTVLSSALAFNCSIKESIVD